MTYLNWPILTKNLKRVHGYCFHILYFMHMNAAWQSLYVCATKNLCELLTFTENFAPLHQNYSF